MTFVKNLPYKAAKEVNSRVRHLLYGNDITRGLDIYKFTASAGRSDTPGNGRDALFCPVGR